MSKTNQIKKLTLATLLVFGVQFVFAAFTTTISGHSNKKSETAKYSLKNISKFSNRGISLGTVKYSFHLKPVELGAAPNNANGMASGSTVEFTKGNTTFIYPYKIKLKVPKFKAPSPINH